MTKILPKNLCCFYVKEREKERKEERARVQLGDLQNMIDVKIK